MLQLSIPISAMPLTPFSKLASCQPSAALLPELSKADPNWHFGGQQSTSLVTPYLKTLKRPVLRFKLGASIEPLPIYTQLLERLHAANTPLAHSFHIDSKVFWAAQLAQKSACRGGVSSRSESHDHQSSSFATFNILT